MHTAALSACYLVMSGCAIALPSTRTEVGRTARPDSNGTQVAVGADLASALPTTVSRFEVGAGLIYRTRNESGVGDLNWQRGGYLDLGYAVLNSKNARVIVGARGERYGHEGALKVLKLRVDAEVLASVSGGGAEASGCSAVIGGSYGNVGFGVFAEAGRSFVIGDEMADARASGWVASAGLTMRLPAIAGIAIGGKSCSRGDSGGSSGSSGSSGSTPHISGD